MAATTLRPESRRRAWLLLPLALMHLALLGWLTHQQRAPAGARGQVLTSVRLLAERPKPRPTLPAPVPMRRAPLPVVVPVPPRLAEPPPAPNTITATPAPVAPAAETPRPAPLILALPPALPASDAQPRWRNPALSDPRANTRRPDYAARMADTLGTDTRLREEALGPGRHRFRQGSSCVETAESRIAQIDPMSETMRGSPRLVTDCK